MLGGIVAILVLGRNSELAMRLVGWGFFCGGLVFGAPILWAIKYWHLVVGRIVSTGNDTDVQVVTFTYSYDGEKYRGTHGETGNKKIGDKISVFVDGINPKRYVVVSAVVLIVTIGVMLMGAVLGLGLIEP